MWMLIVKLELSWSSPRIRMFKARLCNGNRTPQDVQGKVVQWKKKTPHFFFFLWIMCSFCTVQQGAAACVGVTQQV